MASDILGCYTKEMKGSPVKNCVEFAKHNKTSFQECIADYSTETFDNFMLFFGQIEPICQYINDTSPEFSAEVIIEVDPLFFSYANLFSLRIPRNRLMMFGCIWKIFLFSVGLFLIFSLYQGELKPSINNNFNYFAMNK